MSVPRKKVAGSRPRHPTVLVLPGLHGSGPRHWQSNWQRRRREFQRVEQASWSEPKLGDWAATLETAVLAAPAPVILVAHSLACALVAHWARAGATGRVGAALLVAPADVDAMEHVELRSFVPMPLDRLPFPSWVVASENDPYVGLDRARSFARAWGARRGGARQSRGPRDPAQRRRRSLTPTESCRKTTASASDARRSCG